MSRADVVVAAAMTHLLEAFALTSSQSCKDCVELVPKVHVTDGLRSAEARRGFVLQLTSQIPGT